MGKKHKVYQSLLRRPSFFRSDREMTMLLLCVSGTIAIFCMSLPIFVINALLSAMCYFLLYTCTKNDLIIRKLYLRNIKYKPYYAGRAFLHSKKHKLPR